MIETMVALCIFAIIMAGLAPSFVNFLKFNTSAEMKTEAIAAAQYKLDRLRMDNPQDMPAGGTFGPETVTINDRGYSVTTSYCAASEYCTSNNSRHITVSVSYNSEELFEVETVYTVLR